MGIDQQGRSVPLLNLARAYDYMRSDIDAALARCLEHQKWILGPEVKALEEAIGAKFGVAHCVGTSSGSDALVLALRALALARKGREYFKREDLILVPSFTFTATGDAVLRAGATPVLVDINPDTFTMDPAEVQSFLRIVAPGKVVGMIPVHLYGQTCDMDTLMAIGRQYNLFVVEDVAQAFGGQFQDRILGSIGDAAAFSFFPSKNLGGYGDGGMVAVSDRMLADLVRQLTTHGGKNKYNVSYIGYNARLDTIQAAVLLAKLPFVDELNKKRRAIAARYTKSLSAVPHLRLPFCDARAYHVYNQYTITLPAPGRDVLKAFLSERGIESVVYYQSPLHTMPLFRASPKVGSLPCSEKAASEVLGIPIDPLQTEEETDYIIQHIKIWASEYRPPAE